MKKTAFLFSTVVLLSFIFFSIEHVLYTILPDKNILYHLFLALLLVLIPVSIATLTRFNCFGRLVSGITVLASVFIGLAGLKFFIM